MKTNFDHYLEEQLLGASLQLTFVPHENALTLGEQKVAYNARKS